MSSPIGIFDSGVGGLTVAAAIRKHLPNESIIYYGDTEHMPYGEKSTEAIQHYSVRIANFLKDQGCKIIVIACNTASARAYNAVLESVGNTVPVLDVINPVANWFKDKGAQKVGVIGTKATIGSGIYPEKLKAVNPSLDVVSVATPLLAPLVEEGFYNSPISQAVVDNYLSKPLLKNIQSIILACTHYPLIEKEVRKHYNEQVSVIDSADIVAQHVKQVLETSGLINTERTQQADCFYVSDYTDSFAQSTRIFFPENIHLEQKRLGE